MTDANETTSKKRRVDIESINSRLTFLRAELSRAQGHRDEAQRSVDDLEQRIAQQQRQALEYFRQHGHTGLSGMAVVKNVFLFMTDAADILRASTTCRRWREMACDDSVWGRSSMATDEVS